MTDLDTYHIKRSVNDVHYVYVFHSLLSTHRAYRENAFAAYDSIFCASPNHITELQTFANLRPSRPQILYNTGYCRLDTLLAEDKDTVFVNRDIPRVLIAPTWGPSSLLEFGLDKVIHSLLTHNIEVVLRFHPMSVRHNAILAHEYLNRFGKDPLFSLDNTFESSKSLIESDIVLSDWSGAAHEFSLAFLRPTVFIDTPPKSHNDVHHLLGLDCYEDDVRENLGALIALDQIDTVPDVVTTLFNDRLKWQQRLLSLRNSIVFNPGNAIATAATQLESIISQHSTK
jgi:YidC/Oxa1 family membrane protein insertase